MLNEALRLIRVFHDISQKELAQRLDTSNSYISEVEAGKKKPSVDVLEKYARVFGVPLSSIIFFSENIDHADKYHASKEQIARKILSMLNWIAEKEDTQHANSPKNP